jgi:hypothetical protein
MKKARTEVRAFSIVAPRGWMQFPQKISEKK